MQNSKTLNSFKIIENEHFRVLNNQQKKTDKILEIS